MYCILHFKISILILDQQSTLTLVLLFFIYTKEIQNLRKIKERKFTSMRDRISTLGKFSFLKEMNESF